MSGNIVAILRIKCRNCGHAKPPHKVGGREMVFCTKLAISQPADYEPNCIHAVSKLGSLRKLGLFGGTK